MKYIKTVHTVPVVLALMIGLVWSSILFATVYPYPSRWINDDMRYLLVAQNIVRTGEPHMTRITEGYGGDMQNMQRLGKPEPLYEHVVAYHFPSYSYFLAGWLLIMPNEFWAVYAAHTAVYLGIILLTYYFSYLLTARSVTAFVTAVAVAFSPTISMYLSITMMEVFLVFLAMLSIYLYLRPVTVRGNGLLAFVLTVLVISRNSFLVFVLPALLLRTTNQPLLPTAKKIIGTGRPAALRGYWLRFKTAVSMLFSQSSLQLIASGVLCVLLPVAVNFSLGRQGFLFFHEGHHPNTWEDLVKTTQVNWESITSYRFAFTGHPIHEFFFYVGIVVLLLTAKRYAKTTLYWLVAFGHITILTAIFFRYDWFDWRHLRVAMWYLPFAYIFFIAALTTIRVRGIQLALGVAALLMVGLVTNTNRVLLLETLPLEQAAMHTAYTDAQRVITYLDEVAPDANLVMVPRQYLQAAMFDHKRIYYTPYPRSAENAVPDIHNLGVFFDVAFVRQTEYATVADADRYNSAVPTWDATYALLEPNFYDMTVAIRKTLSTAP